MRALSIFLFVFSYCHLAIGQMNNTISLGVGVPNIPRYFFNNLKSNTDFKSVGLGPLHLKYENRISSWFALGYNANYIDYTISYTTTIVNSNGDKVPNNVKISCVNLANNARLNFHFLNPENNPNWDLYFGFGVGFRVGKFRIVADYEEYAPKIDLPNLSVLGLETTFGTRYFLNDNLGLYAEIGIAKSIVQGGLAYRF